MESWESFRARLRTMAPTSASSAPADTVEAMRARADVTEAPRDERKRKAKENLERLAREEGITVEELRARQVQEGGPAKQTRGEHGAKAGLAAITAAAPTAAAILAPAAVGSLVGPLGTLGGLAVGLGAAFGTNLAQQKIMEATGVAGDVGQGLGEYRQEHPYESLVAENVPQALALRPGRESLKAANLVLGGGIGGATELWSQARSNEPWNMGRVAESAGLSALFSTPYGPAGRAMAPRAAGPGMAEDDLLARLPGGPNDPGGPGGGGGPFVGPVGPERPSIRPWRHGALTPEQLAAQGIAPDGVSPLGAVDLSQQTADLPPMGPPPVDSIGPRPQPAIEPPFPTVDVGTASIDPRARTVGPTDVETVALERARMERAAAVDAAAGEDLAGVKLPVPRKRKPGDSTSSLERSRREVADETAGLDLVDANIGRAAAGEDLVTPGGRRRVGTVRVEGRKKPEHFYEVEQTAGADDGGPYVRQIVEDGTRFEVRHYPDRIEIATIAGKEYRRLSVEAAAAEKAGRADEAKALRKQADATLGKGVGEGGYTFLLRMAKRRGVTLMSDKFDSVEIGASKRWERYVREGIATFDEKLGRYRTREPGEAGAPVSRFADDADMKAWYASPDKWDESPYGPRARAQRGASDPAPGGGAADGHEVPFSEAGSGPVGRDPLSARQPGAEPGAGNDPVADVAPVEPAGPGAAGQPGPGGDAAGPVPAGAEAPAAAAEAAPGAVDSAAGDVTPDTPWPELLDALLPRFDPNKPQANMGPGGARWDTSPAAVAKRAEIARRLKAAGARGTADMARALEGLGMTADQAGAYASKLTQEGAFGGGPGAPPPPDQQAPPPPPGQPQPAPPPPPEVQILRTALREAVPVRGQQNRAYTAERKQKAARLEQVDKQGGEAAFDQKRAILKGELPTVQFTGVRQRFTQDQVDNLFRTIDSTPVLRWPFERFNAGAALKALIDTRGGRVPQDAELALLDKVFPGIAADVKAARPFWRQAGDFLLESVNLSRSLVTAPDMSAPLRQGFVLSTSHPRIAGRAAREMVKSFFSPEAYKALEQNIQLRQNRPLYDEAGLFLADPNGPAISLREEAFVAGPLAERILGIPADLVKWALPPVARDSLAGRVGIGALNLPRAAYQGSQRAYAAYLNKLRADVFDLVAGEFQAGGLSPENNPTEFKALASYINMATGHGGLGKYGERAAPVLTGVLFSPRFLAARLQALGHVATAGQLMPPALRKEALRSALSTAGTIAGLLYLGKLAGGDVEVSPMQAGAGPGVSSNWLKVRIGKTRFDVAAGFQQWLRYSMQIALGARRTDTGAVVDANRLTSLHRLFRSKMQPTAGVIHDLLNGGENMLGESLEADRMLAENFFPMIAQDVEALYEEHAVAPIAAVGTGFAWFGGGVQTYGQDIPPAYMVRTPAENALAVIGMQAATGANRDERATRDLMRNFEGRLRGGEDIEDVLLDSLKKGLLSEKQANLVMQRADLDPWTTRFKALPLAQAEQVYTQLLKVEPERKEAWGKLLEEKRLRTQALALSAKVSGGRGTREDYRESRRLMREVKKLERERGVTHRPKRRTFVEESPYAGAR